MKAIPNSNKIQIGANLFVIYEKNYDTITYYVHGKRYSNHSASGYREELEAKVKYGNWVDDGMLEWLNKVTS